MKRVIAAIISLIAVSSALSMGPSYVMSDAEHKAEVKRHANKAAARK